MTKNNEDVDQQSNEDEKAKIEAGISETMKRMEELNFQQESTATNTGQTEMSASEITTMLKEFNEMLDLLKDTGVDKIISSISVDNSAIAQPNDKPNKYAHLEFRVIYTLVAWVVLGKGIIQGQAFFVSIFLFVIPLFMDYLKFDTPSRPWVRKLGIGISVVWTIFSLLGLFNILSIIETKAGFMVMIAKNYIMYGGVSVSISDIWLLMISCVAITIFDLFYYEPSSLNPSNVSGGN